MGLERALINHRDKTYFWLGKGSWYPLTNQLDLLQDKDLLRESLRDCFEETFCWSDNHSYLDEDDLKYLEEITDKVFAFVNGAKPEEITLGNDSDDSIYDFIHQGYKKVGSRYKDDDPNEPY
jgi:hypothetical protein